MLRVFNLQFGRGNKGNLSFCKKIPTRFQEGFSEFRYVALGVDNGLGRDIFARTREGKDKI